MAHGEIGKISDPFDNVAIGRPTERQDAHAGCADQPNNALRILPGCDRTSGRRTDRHVDVELMKPDAVHRQRIEIRRFDLGIPESRKIAPPQVVDEQQEDVWLWRCGSRERLASGERKRKGRCGASFRTLANGRGARAGRCHIRQLASENTHVSEPATLGSPKASCTTRTRRRRRKRSPGMNRRYVKPIGTSSRSPSIRAEKPDLLDDLMEDPPAQIRDMTSEQRAAFVPPDTRDPRIERSQGDQGRT